MDGSATLLVIHNTHQLHFQSFVACISTILGNERYRHTQLRMAHTLMVRKRALPAFRRGVQQAKLPERRGLGAGRRKGSHSPHHSIFAVSPLSSYLSSCYSESSPPPPPPLPCAALELSRWRACNLCRRCTGLFDGLSRRIARSASMRGRVRVRRRGAGVDRGGCGRFSMPGRRG